MGQLLFLAPPKELLMIKLPIGVFELVYFQNYAPTISRITSVATESLKDAVKVSGPLEHLFPKTLGPGITFKLDDGTFISWLIPEHTFGGKKNATGIRDYIYEQLLRGTYDSDCSLQFAKIAYALDQSVPLRKTVCEEIGLDYSTVQDKGLVEIQRGL